jgi:hypothetical protein
MQSAAPVSPVAGASGTRHTPPQDDTQSHKALTHLSRKSMSEQSDRTEQQLDLLAAIEAGREGMAQATDAAERRDPLFAVKAEAAIVACLKGCKQRRASSEDLVDAARAQGLVPHDDRAFGPVFQSMARRGVIRFVGFCLRKKGHGTAGGRIWALCQ